MKSYLPWESGGVIVPWICSFLKNRHQCVRYNLTFSDYAILAAGVPQSTKLGPIPFHIIINDAACNSNTSCWNYADDLTFGVVRNQPTETEPCQLPSYSNMLYEKPTTGPWPQNWDQVRIFCFLCRSSGYMVAGVPRMPQIDHLCKNAIKQMFMLRTLRYLVFIHMS